MKRNIRVLFVFILIASLLLSACSNRSKADTESEVVDPQIKSIPFHSQNVEDDFIIDISLPSHYNASKKYPVVYLTDGNWRRKNHKDIHALSDQKVIKDVIVVGISYPEGYNIEIIRQRDFLEGKDKFLLFIIDELIPYMDKNYNIDSLDRTLCGHSYGGYFTMYSLLEYKNKTEGIFKNYIIGSPSLWVVSDNEKLMQNEIALSEKTKNLPVNVYMTVGGLEEEDYMIQPLELMVKQMQDHNYKGLELRSSIVPAKDHISVWEPALLDGLKMFLIP